jgi:protein involved in polysaccharide export with SLBB domain
MKYCSVSMRIALAISLLFFLAGCSGVGDSLFGSRDLLRSSSPNATAQAASTEYRFGTGDVISVRVYGGEEEIRLERVRLDDSGTITLPFGDFKARGATSRELEATITESVRGRVLRNPRVGVTIDEYRPFFVEGQVQRPGAYPFQVGLNVRRAITIAGGFRERASMDKIFVFRDRDPSNKPAKVDLNAPVGPGDTITVQESFF